MIRVLVVGKKHEAWIEAGVRRYERRLQRPWDIKWDFMAHSLLNDSRARQEESERLLARLKDDEYVILLDEVGRLFDSPDLSRQMEDLMGRGWSIVIVVGGAYGVSDALRTRANIVWSLSPLVFPHQLVRLILAEQLYRAQQISLNGPYHHR